MPSTDPLLDAGHLFTIKQNVLPLAPSFFPGLSALRSFLFLAMIRNLVKPAVMHALMGSGHDWTCTTLSGSSKRLYVVFLRTVTNKCFNLCRSQGDLQYYTVKLGMVLNFRSWYYYLQAITIIPWKIRWRWKTCFVSICTFVLVKQRNSVPPLRIVVDDLRLFFIPTRPRPPAPV